MSVSADPFPRDLRRTFRDYSTEDSGGRKSSDTAEGPSTRCMGGEDSPSWEPDRPQRTPPLSRSPAGTGSTLSASALKGGVGSNDTTGHRGLETGQWGPLLNGGEVSILQVPVGTEVDRPEDRNVPVRQVCPEPKCGSGPVSMDTARPYVVVRVVPSPTRSLPQCRIRTHRREHRVVWTHVVGLSMGSCVVVLSMGSCAE